MKEPGNTSETGPSPRVLSFWPPCATAGCLNKCCKRLRSNYCFPCTLELCIKEAVATEDWQILTELLLRINA